MIPAGLKSKCFLTASTKRASETFPVSNVLIEIYQVESLPYTSTGKLQRKKVKSEDLNEGKNNES